MRTTKTLRTFAPAAVIVAASFAVSCDTPETFVPYPQFGGPAGVIDGAAVYTGPPPCTAGGRILGAGVVLAFNVQLLPPPEGLGVSAASVDAIPGEVLFDGIRDQLVFAKDGAVVCPAPDYPPVTVSAPWAMAPLPAGTYQIRGFYDIDGDFDPAFKISNLPSKGDVGGGAIDNAAEVLAGGAPRYREIPLGVVQPDGSLVIPPEGSRITGVTVTYGLPLPLERPVFHAREVLDENGTNTDPNNVVMASDFQMNTFSEANPSATETSFIRYRFGGGVPAAEVDLAAVSPFNMPVKGSPGFLFTRQDVNGDGVLDGEDHVPDSQVVPSLFPLGLFTKLVDGAPLVSQDRPSVILQGLTIYKSLLDTALSAPGLNDTLPEVTVALRPAVLCIDPGDASKPGVLVTTHETDSMGNKLIQDEEVVKGNLSAQFGRPINLVYGCLPQGQYAANLVYGTGQAWTVPNEAGLCAPSEPPSVDGALCGTRAKLASQGVVLTIGPPNDPMYCVMNPTPAECFP